MLNLHVLATGGQVQGSQFHLQGLFLMKILQIPEAEVAKNQPNHQCKLNELGGIKGTVAMVHGTPALLAGGSG